MLRRIVAYVAVALLLAVAAVVGIQAVGARSGPDPARIFNSPLTAELAAAIAAGEQQQVRELVKAGAKLDDRGQDDVTLLQWAILRDEPQMLKLLIELGADPRQQGYGGRTAVHMAAMSKRMSFLRVLLENGASPNVPDGRTQAPVLAEALMSGNHDAVAMLLKHRADPNLADRQGNTALHVAAQINDYDSMLALLEAGADPALRNKSGHTFAVYFNIQPDEKIMSWEAKSKRKTVKDWLASHGHAATLHP